MAAEGPRGGLKRSLRSTVKSMLWCARLLEMQLCLRFCTVRIWISFDSWCPVVGSHYAPWR